MAALLAGCAVLAGCSSSSSPATTAHHTPKPAGSSTPPPTTTSGQAPASPASRPPLALVTAENQNELVAVSLTTDRIVRRMQVAADPKTVAAAPGGPIIVVSPGSGTVTLLSYPRLRPVAVLRSFRSPQIAAAMPDGEWALVTDGAAGTVSTVEFANRRVVGRLQVGLGAHHIAVSPDRRRAWVALGETANTIVVVDCSNPRHLAVVRRLDPPIAVHDLAFSPDGSTVWVSSANAPRVLVMDAHSGSVVGTVPAGPAPQHITFDGADAYITSGYGSSIEKVNTRTRRVLTRAGLPYGSFNLASNGNIIVTTSLLDGKVSVLRATGLQRLATLAVAPNARAVAVVSG